jgi:putative ABC transport system permease protein
MKNQSIHPPKLADKIFQWYCNQAMVEDLHGDLEEIFYDNVKKMSLRKAKLWYWRQVISLIFSYAIKRRKKNAAHHPFSSSANNLDMLKNYFKIAVRSLARQKFFSIINVLGLSIGMSISLLLVAMLSYVFRYDTFHVNRDRIYRVISYTDDLQRNDAYASAPVPLAELLRNDYTGIDEVVRVNSSLSADATFNEKTIPLQGYFADANFLTVFSFPLLKGNPETALTKINSLVITESAATKMFGDEDALGKVITMGDFGDFVITGLMKDHPKNSHLYFEVIASYETLVAFQRQQQSVANSWTDFRDNYIYLLLPKEKETDGINSFLARVSRKTYKSTPNFKAQFELQSLNDIAPGPELRDQIGPEWGYASLSIFGVLTLMILVPACFNYASISMSRAMKRSKEIGLRKVVGGQRSQIFFQFVMETVIITLVALAGSFLIFIMIRHEFISMLVSSAGLELNTDPITIICFVLFAIVVGFLSGIVPATYFSRISPVNAFKKNFAMKMMKGINFRKVLIVGQFAISLGFIMSVVIVLNQYRASLAHNYGFNQENILDVALKDVDPQIFKNEFSRLASVQSLSMSSNIVGTSTAGSVWVQEATGTDSIEVSQLFADEGFIQNMGLTLLSGNSFEERYPDKEKFVVVNETFLKSFKIGRPADALNRTFKISNDREVIVIGVVKDFNYASLREPIKNFFLRYDPKQFRYANLKIKSSDIYTTISGMESVWRTFKTEEKFQADFFSDELDEAYSFYFVMIKICGFLGLLAISISCLGLLGMVVYTVEIRTKEVGVRKVMGASEYNVVYLLSRDFIKLMVIASMIATPLTYLFFDKIFLKLQSSYAIQVGIAEIVISLLIMLLFGAATVFSQTIRAARSNPVDTLRME